MPNRATLWGASPEIDAPCQRMSPLSSLYTPLMQLSSVVFPAPLGPMMPRISPFATEKVTPSSAATPPKRLVTLCSSS